MILSHSEKEGLCVLWGELVKVFSKVHKHIPLRRCWVERPEAGMLEQTLWKSRWRAFQTDRRTWTQEFVECLRKWKEANVTGVEWRVVRTVASGDFTADCEHCGFTLSWELIWGCSLKKKNAQPNCWELCFIQWTFLRLQAQETATQITLRYCSKEARGQAKIHRSFCNKRPSGQS